MNKVTHDGVTRLGEPLTETQRAAIEAAGRLPDSAIDVTDPDAPEVVDWSGAVRGRTASRFALHDPVVLRSRLRAEGKDLPAGAEGAVVLLVGEGRACVVEFFVPSHAVVTVPVEQLAPLDT
ncbi:MAG: hypothetical protein ACOYOH_28450 [Paracraurococcus sp.]